MKYTLLKKISVIRLVLLTLILGIANTQSSGQIINYPVPAQALTHGFGNSLLTVQVAFSGACTSTGVKILLPASVTYVPGSITKTGGSLSNAITEANITNLSNPGFSIGSVTGAGDITFTIQRTAGCGSLSSGKDTIQVSSGCGVVTENGGNLNNYSVFAPSLALTAPAAINNAVINGTATRTTTITNGGNGCLDTLRFYIVYPNAGIALTSAGSSITANGVAFTPYATGGDTLYYKIFGGALFGGDNMLCNGEVVTITEPIVIRKCGAATYYGAGWGRNSSNICQCATGTSAITMANGVPSISAVYTRQQAMNWCQKGIFTIAYTNNGSSTGIESAAYNLVANLGYNGTGNATVPAGITSSNLGRIDSVKIGSVTVSLTAATASTAAKAIFSALTADPDGTGTGLEDLDGDGQYDDLGSGKTVTITVYEHWVDNSANCPITVYRFFNSHTASYTTMCGTAYTTNPLSTGANSTVAGAYSIQSTAASVVLPAEVTGNNPFNIQICMNLGSMFEPTYKPKDSLYMDMVLPAGMSLSGTGNITYNGTAITTAGKYYVDTVGGVVTLHIARKGKNATFCLAATLVYDCTIGGGGTLSPNFNIYYIGDNCSAAKEGYLCGPRTINARCPSPCADGIRNYQPIATRLNLGYTDQTLATKVAATAVTGLAKYTALPLDTIQIIVPGKQFAAAGLFTNLYYNLQFGKIASANVFQYLDGTFNQKNIANVTTSNAIGVPTDYSTTTLQKMRWNLSSNLNAGTITSGDSVWLVLRFAVTRANTDKLYGNSLQQVPGTSSTLYNINAANANVGCDTAHQINLLVSGITASNYTPEVTLSGCSAATTSSNLYLGNSTGLDIFPNEYRPQSIVDSVAITLPTGYVLFPTTNNLNTAYWPSVSSFSYYGNVSTGVVADRGNNKWVIQNPNMATGGWKLADFGNSSAGSYPLGYSISPTCASVAGSQAQSLTWYYRDFIYTNPSSYVSKTLTVGSNLTYNTTVKPAITIQNNTGTINGVLSQHNWQVQINSTGNGTASYIWMALNTSASGITIDSVVYNNAVVPAISYGSGKVWYQLNSGGIPAGSNIKPTIYFKYLSCNADSIQMLAGWNCPGYPASPDAYVCNVATQYLKILPQPSQVQLSISRAPGNGGSISLCNSDSVTVIMNSAQSANLVAPKVTLMIPGGINIITPIPVEYPLGSGHWQNITPTAISGGYSIDLTQHTGIGASLPGTATNPASAGRQAKIKVAFTTDCSFTSGSQFDFYGYGNSPCGSAAVGNGADVRSGAVNIAGANTSAGMAMTVSVPVTSLTCGGSTTLTFSSTPLITGTQAGDSILYNLPVGLTYNGNFNSLSNCTSCGVRNIPGNNGINQVKIGLMPGIAANTPIRFSFDVIVDRAGCGQTSVNAQAERTIAGLSCGAMNCGQSQTVIGTASSTTLAILKPDITINNISIAGNQNLYPGGTLALVVNYTNTGSIAVGGNTKVIEFFMGNSTTPFAIRTLTRALAVNGNGVDTFTVTLPPTGTAGDLITGKVQTTTAGGADQCVCSTQSFKMLGQPLPVTLLSFTANMRTAHSVDTHWEMATEKGFSGYTVQRSADGVTFTAIANVTAQDHSDKTAYTITDTQLPAGVTTLYYRLALYSNDGSHSYSTTATVQVPASSDDVTLAPNPAKDQLRVTLPQQWQQPVHILITNFVGQQVLMQDAGGTSGVTLDISQLPGGLYTVTVQDAAGQERISKKLSVMR